MKPPRFGGIRRSLAVAAALAGYAGWAMAAENPDAIAPESETVLVTVFLKHTQALTLEEMGENLRANGFFEKFPPGGVEVVSWVQLMSFGHVVTLAVPPAKVRELNRSIESGSYTTFKSEVYLGYDFWPVVQAIKARRAEE